MKIIFTTTGKNWDSPLDKVFGRTEGFLLYDQETSTLDWFSNSENKNAGHGAGIQAGQNVVNLGAQVVITGGDVGPKALDVLKKGNVKIFSGVKSKTVRQALQAYQKGELL